MILLLKLYFSLKVCRIRNRQLIWGAIVEVRYFPSLNYGEAKGAESKNDFLHKMKVCLKELRESYNCTRVMYRAKIYKSEQQVKELITECNELISIFVKSIETASKGKPTS